MTPVAGAEQSSGSSANAGADSRPAPSTNGQTIPLSLRAISPQFPANFLAAVTPESMARITINIPAEWVLPQLASGRVTITLADLMPLLPGNLSQQRFPTTNSQHAIVLPLADIVAALPVDLLQHQNQTEVDLDTPEFAQFPNLIDDITETPAVEKTMGMDETVAIVEPKAPTSDVETASAETTSALPPVEEATPPPRSLAVKMAHPIPVAGEPLPLTATPQTPSNGSEITVSLRSLVAVMPDQYFVCPRTDLWRRIDLDSRIALPADLVVPQLKSARVRLPMTVAVGLMPRSILASPLPSISDETIPIALQEIVSQLPANLFASQSKASDMQEIDFSDSDIPTPFAEKDLPPATVEIRAPEMGQRQPIPAPSEPEPVPEPIEGSSGAFKDEGLPIFAERPAATETAPAEAEVEPPASEAQEPTAVEPVAEVATPAPVETEPPAITEAPQTEELPVAVGEAKAEEPAPVEEASAEPIANVAPTTPAETEPPAAVEPEPAVEEVAEGTTPAPVAIEPPVVIETPQAVEPPAVPAEPVEIAAAAETATTPVEPAPVAETPAPTAPETAHEAETPELAAPAPSAGRTWNQFLVNFNNCTVADLARIEGIGPVLAQRIIEFRNTRGGFKSLDDLREVPGISRKLLHTLVGPSRSGLNRLLGVEHNEELTLQEVVRLTSQLTGVAGCILAMSDGVFLTGQLPPHLDQETISVFAPQLFRKVGRYMKELRAGEVTRLSVFTDQQPISIFRAHDIFLIVVHDNVHFSKALLRRCERISQELARVCHQRAVV
jgi:competence ComEA-like helix-hairpin-helix protein